MGSDNDDYSFSWDDKRAGTKVLLSKVFSRISSLLLPQKTSSESLPIVGDFNRTSWRKAQKNFNYTNHMQTTTYAP